MRKKAKRSKKRKETTKWVPPSSISDGEEQQNHPVTSDRGEILKAMKPFIMSNTLFLEIGSGTGHCLMYFAKELPDVQFQPAEAKGPLLDEIKLLVSSAELPNICEPKPLDVMDSLQFWMDGVYSPRSINYIFTISILHIRPLSYATALFAGCGMYLKQGGLLFLYGSFAYNAIISSDTDRLYDNSLRLSNPAWGIRDVNTELIEIALANQLHLIRILRITEENDLLVWNKKG